MLRGAEVEAELRNQARQTSSVEWRQRMRDLGATVRRAREFLAFSQDRLAQMAGVSQGAVSRLEAGRGSATPLVVVAKIRQALTTALDDVEPATVSDDLRHALDAEPFFAPVRGLREAPAAPTPADRELEELIGRYRGLPPNHRATVRGVLRLVMDGWD